MKKINFKKAIVKRSLIGALVVAAGIGAYAIFNSNVDSKDSANATEQTKSGIMIPREGKNKGGERPNVAPPDGSTTENQEPNVDANSGSSEANPNGQGGKAHKNTPSADEGTTESTTSNVEVNDQI